MTNEFDSGYIFAPYVPLEQTPVVEAAGVVFEAPYWYVGLGDVPGPVDWLEEGF